MPIFRIFAIVLIYVYIWLENKWSEVCQTSRFHTQYYKTECPKLYVCRFQDLNRKIIPTLLGSRLSSNLSIYGAKTKSLHSWDTKTSLNISYNFYIKTSFKTTKKKISLQFTHLDKVNNVSSKTTKLIDSHRHKATICSVMSNIDNSDRSSGITHLRRLSPPKVSHMLVDKCGPLI